LFEPCFILDYITLIYNLHFKDYTHVLLYSSTRIVLYGVCNYLVPELEQMRIRFHIMLYIDA